MVLDRRWMWRGAALGLAFLGLGYAFYPRAVPVDIAKVETFPLMVTVDDDGETRIRDIYVVSTPLSGRVMRFEGEVGDTVRAGETVLVNILPSDPTFLDLRTRTELKAVVEVSEAARELAAAEVQKTEAALDFARAELDRAEDLAKRGTLSKAALDRTRMEARTAEAELKTARAALDMREHELETANAALIPPDERREGANPDGSNLGCCFPIRAPIDGQILRIFQKSENVVVAGAPLVEIGDPTGLEVVVDLLSSDAVRLSVGDRALIERWGGGKSLEGRVRRIEPFGFTKISALGIEEQRVNVLIDFVDPVERWHRLGHGYRVQVRVVLWQGDSVLTVPISALFRRGTDWAVFVVENGRARLRTVTIGHMDGRAAEVLDGLADSDRVVVHPSDRVSDRTRVTPRNRT